MSRQRCTDRALRDRPAPLLLQPRSDAGRDLHADADRIVKWPWPNTPPPPPFPCAYKRWRCADPIMHRGAALSPTVPGPLGVGVCGVWEGAGGVMSRRVGGGRELGAGAGDRWWAGADPVGCSSGAGAGRLIPCPAVAPVAPGRFKVTGQVGGGSGSPRACRPADPPRR